MLQIEGPKQVARRSDIDMNGHINNVTYLAWTQETIPLDTFLNYKLHQVSSIRRPTEPAAPRSSLKDSICTARLHLRSVRRTFTTTSHAWPPALAVAAMVAPPSVLVFEAEPDDLRPCGRVAPKIRV